MSIQNFFYLTSSSAIIVLALLFVVLIILGIIIAIRIAKIFRNISNASEEVSKTAKNLREKIKIPALTGILVEGLKEIILFAKNKRQKKQEKGKKEIR